MKSVRSAPVPHLLEGAMSVVERHRIVPDCPTRLGLGAVSDSLRAPEAYIPGCSRRMANLMTCSADAAIKKINVIPSPLQAKPCQLVGTSKTPNLRVNFDRRLKLKFMVPMLHQTSDAGIHVYREYVAWPR